MALNIDPINFLLCILDLVMCFIRPNSKMSSTYLYFLDYYNDKKKTHGRIKQIYVWHKMKNQYQALLILVLVPFRIRKALVEY